MMTRAITFLLLVGVAHAAPLAQVRPAGTFEVVTRLSGPMPTGVAVSRAGRVFVNFPRWGEAVRHTVGEVRGDDTVPYPSAAWNRAGGPAASRLVAVQSVVVDAADRLWALDTGDPGDGPIPGGPKLVCVDLRRDRVVRTIPIPPGVYLPGTYLNDVRFDLSRNVAYITDSHAHALIVVDLKSGASRRRLHAHASTRPAPGFVPFVEGRALFRRTAQGPRPFAIGADGIALSPDGRTLYYCPLSARRLYAIDAQLLADPRATDAQVAAAVRDLGEKPASDGLECDARGRVFATDYEHGAIQMWTEGRFETVLFDPRLLWPDTLALANGWLYVTANQLHRQKGFQGQDRREPPYLVLRTRVP